MLDSLPWLNQASITDGVQPLSDSLMLLAQMMQQGHPVAPGFVVPDRIMRSVWAQTKWCTEILQEFPYLRLNVVLSQSAQTQFIAQAIQKGIIDQPLQKDWGASWKRLLRPYRHHSLLLTPYVWTAPQTVPPSLAFTMLNLPLRICAARLDSFWPTLQLLWAQLFSAQHLHILQHLGLRPEHVGLDVLVQPLSHVQTSGWMKASDRHLFLQAVPQLALENWPETGLPESYYCDRQSGDCEPVVLVGAIQPAEPQISPPPSAYIPRTNASLLAPESLQALQSLVAPLSATPTLEDKTFLWALKGGAQGVTPQILGIVPDLPLPISLSEGQARAQTLSLALSSAPQVAILEKEEADLEAEGVFEQVLARGIAASSGWAAGPVCVIKDYSQVVPSSLKGVILAVDSFEPIHLPWLKAAAGLICEKGGITSHGAIMARELGCPAVVGVADITQILATGQWVALRGDVGEIYACDAKDARAFVAPKQPPATALPQFPLATQLLVSCSQPSQLKALAKAKCDGVGLVRGEWLLWGQLEQFTDNTVDDFTQLQQSIAEDLVAMARTVAPRPLYYRSIDADALDRNWLNRTERMGTEQNPAIGTRGILRYQANAAQFDAELRLLKGLLDQGICNLRLILPFVRSPEEVVFCSQRMQAMGLDPEHELPLWMMAEVPSVLFGLERYKDAGIQGITVGLNDWAQLLLGIDRDHPAFYSLLMQNQAPLKQAIVQLVRQASALNLPSIVCGSIVPQMLESWLEQLIHAGLTGVCVDMESLSSMRQAIARVEARLSTP